LKSQASKVESEQFIDSLNNIQEKVDQIHNKREASRMRRKNTEDSS